MRTTLDLPDDLVDDAKRALGFKSKTDTVVHALREVVRRKKKDDLIALLRRVEFTDAPGEMRRKGRERARAHP